MGDWEHRGGTEWRRRLEIVPDVSSIDVRLYQWSNGKLFPPSPPGNRYSVELVLENFRGQLPSWADWEEPLSITHDFGDADGKIGVEEAKHLAVQLAFHQVSRLQDAVTSWRAVLSKAAMEDARKREQHVFITAALAERVERVLLSVDHNSQTDETRDDANKALTEWSKQTGRKP